VLAELALDRIEPNRTEPIDRFDFSPREPRAEQRSGRNDKRDPGRRANKRRRKYDSAKRADRIELIFGLVAFPV
jgi:hypothetical protein